jgi:GNAT superfamily N-acetyltransferase
MKTEIKKYQHSVELLSELSKIGFDYNIYRELGYPVYSDKDHTWYLAYISGELVGFCASINKLSKTIIAHDYVVPEFRKQGIYTELFNYRFEDISGLITSAVTNKSIGVFIKNKFTVVRKTKNYYFVELQK